MDTDLEIPEAAKHSTSNWEMGAWGGSTTKDTKNKKNLKPETGAKN
jgi:hypothetical protein